MKKQRLILTRKETSVEVMNKEVELFEYTLVDPDEVVPQGHDHTAMKMMSCLSSRKRLSNASYYVCSVCTYDVGYCCADYCMDAKPSYPYVPFQYASQWFSRRCRYFELEKLTCSELFVLHKTWCCKHMDTLIGIGTSVAYVYSIVMTLVPALGVLLRVS